MQKSTMPTKQPSKKAVVNNSPTAISKKLWRMAYWNILAPLRAVFIKLVAYQRNSRSIDRMLIGSETVSLELGGPRRPDMDGWLFSDWNGYGDFTFDLSKPLPLPDECVNMVYMSHVLEHFSYPSPMLSLLGECRRIIKRGGTIRIAVPDARNFIAAYQNPCGFDRTKYCGSDVGLDFQSPINYINYVAYLGGEHRHLFDPIELERVLVRAGFSNVSSVDRDPLIDPEWRAHDSIYATGVRA